MVAVGRTKLGLETSRPAFHVRGVVARVRLVRVDETKVRTLRVAPAERTRRPRETPPGRFLAPDDVGQAERRGPGLAVATVVVRPAPETVLVEGEIRPPTPGLALCPQTGDATRVPTPAVVGPPLEPKVVARPEGLARRRAVALALGRQAADVRVRPVVEDILAMATVVVGRLALLAGIVPPTAVATVVAAPTVLVPGLAPTPAPKVLAVADQLVPSATVIGLEEGLGQVGTRRPTVVAPAVEVVIPVGHEVAMGRREVAVVAVAVVGRPALSPDEVGLLVGNSAPRVDTGVGRPSTGRQRPRDVGQVGLVAGLEETALAAAPAVVILPRRRLVDG